jgi:MFS family permease
MGRADAGAPGADPRRAPASDTPHRMLAGLHSEALTGLRVLFGHPLLAPIVVSATLGAGAGAMQGALLVVYLVRDLGLTPAAVGLAVAAAGLAAVVGALVAPAVIQRLGPGPSYLMGGLLAGLSGLLLAAAQGPPAIVTVWLLAGQIVAGLGPSLYSVPQTTLRQSLVPDHLLGRANAAWRFLVFGVQPLGAVAGGALGSTIGVRGTLVVASLGILLACLYALRSPVRTVRTLPH